MNETQRNIKQYKAALPGLRERIAASAMLLLVSLSMVVSASFAWYTISAAPEVSMMATTVAANGNLEIALADGLVKDGQKQPEEVAIGDSASAEGKNIVSANVTWGNLVNLSDKSYGLGEISLRPAKLSEYNLSRTPLYGATYSGDGRVEDVDEYYWYTSYSKISDNKYDFSGKPEHLKYGLRAISSVQLTADSASAELNRLFEAAELAFRGEEGKYNGTIGTYNGIISGNLKIPNTDGTPSNVSYMDALVNMLQIFVNDTAKSTLKNHNNSLISGMFKDFKPTDYRDTVPGLLKLLERYSEVLDSEGDALCHLANMYIYTKEQATGATKEEIAQKYVTDGEALRAANKADLKALGIADTLLNVLEAHKKDYVSIQTAISDINTYLIPKVKNNEKIYWDSDYYEMDGNAKLEKYDNNVFLVTHISKLVSISDTKVGTNGTMLGINKLASQGVEKALEILRAETIEVEIGGGVLKNTEDRIGDLLRENDTKNLTNKLGTIVQININIGGAGNLLPGVNGNHDAAVRTDASITKGFTLINEMSRTAGLQPAPTDIVKKDTYAFSIDFWVRTNGDNSILTLEGSPEYETRDAKCTNINGEETQVWVASKTVKLEQEGTGDAAGDGTDTQADGESGGSAFDDLLNGGTPTETITMDVYKLTQVVTEQDENGNEVTNTYHYIYDANTHVILGTEESMTEEGYTFAKKEIKVITGYDGVDRIWEDMASEGLLLEDNLTQGAGSCYVFYADPSDQERILDMLRYFTIAFLDSNNTHMATAKLDVESAYAINGKVTVPLVMVKGPEYEAEDDEGNTETMRGIVALPRSTPTWLTAIVYVDGEEIGNQNVMESGVVEGRLNLQFGSVDVLTGAQDLPLQQKYRTITATAISGNQSSTQSDQPVTFSYDGSKKTVTVRLRVEGDQPTSITGFFTRMIGKNHGSKMESKDFVRTELEGNVGTWEAEFELTNPGNYVFLSVLADGAEYEFEPAVDASNNPIYDSDGTVVRMAPAVKISGREILTLNCEPDGGVYYTSADSMDISVSASIAASPELAPKQVRALFSTGDGKEFTVILGNTGNGDTASHWDGTARITEGGTYILEYLVVDGDKTELSEEQKTENTYVVKLGVRAEVECEKIQAVMKDDDTDDTNNPMEDVEGLTFPYDRDVDHFAVTLKIKLYDNQNNEIRSQSGVSLTYLKDGSTVAGTDNMHMTLKWKEQDEGYYEGKAFVNHVGIYRFYQMVIPTGNVITLAPDAPVFSILSPEPPAWYDAGDGNITAEDQYAPNGGAKMYAYFTNADTAVAYAQIKNVKTGETQWKPSTGIEIDNDTGVARFEFDVPMNSTGNTGANKNGYAGDCTGTQDGEWVIVAACLQNVYDSNDVYYPETVENGVPVGGMFFNEDGSLGYEAVNMSSIQTAVSQKTFATGTATGINNGVVTLGKTGSEITGTFMQSHNIPGVTVTITDWKGDAVPGVYDAALIVDHQTDVDAKTGKPAYEPYGGYTFTSEQQSGFTDETWNLTSTDGKTFTLAAAQDLVFAGTYKVSLRYKLTGDPNTENNPIAVNDVFKYEIWSKRPEVKVTGITTGTISVHNGTRGSDGTVTYNQTISGDFNKKSDYSAVVFLAASGREVNIPEVKLTLTDMPGGSFTATMLFPNDSRSSDNRTYTFTANNQEKGQSIGGRDNGSNGLWGLGATNPKIFPAGNHTVDELNVVYGKETFTVKLRNSITINQPQIPLYVDFAINNDSYTGAVPGRMYSMNGETVEVTLPDANDITAQWPEEMSTSQTSNVQTIVDDEQTNYYETWRSWGTNYYQTYTQHVTVTQAEEVYTTFTRTWKITGWRIGNTTYALGEKVTLTSNQTITAVFTSSDSGHQPEEYILTTTTTYYTTGSDTRGSSPDSTKNITTEQAEEWDGYTQSNPKVELSRKLKD